MDNLFDDVAIEKDNYGDYASVMKFWQSKMQIVLCPVIEII